MDFAPVVEKYSISDALSAFYEIAPDFAFSETFAQQYLTRDWFRDVNRWLNLDETMLDAITAAAERIAADAGLVKLCEYCRHVYFEHNFSPESLAMLGCPLPNGGETLLNELFGLIVHLSGIERVRERYAKRGIPECVMRDTYQTVRIWLETHKATHGRWGFTRTARGNPRMHHIAGLRLFRIGRLEFESNCFTGAIVGLRHNATGDSVAVLEGGTPLRRDGLINGTNDRYDPEAVLCGYDETDEYICAHPVQPNGLGTTGQIRYSLKDWTVILRRGYACLKTHIPRGGKLDIEASLQSFDMAREFFPRYFPECRFAVFACRSWLLDVQLRDLLPPSSNIVRFGKRFHCFPEPSDDNGIVSGVFDDKQIDIRTFKPVTSLQKAIVSHYQQGGRLHNGGGFIVF